MNIAIFGAGIAGLMAGITLRSQGHGTRIYERARRGHETGMGFILMPEAEEFRRLYSPGMKASLPQLLADLRECYGVTVIDARTWIADDCFWDAHHLMPHGAAQFTERLREAVCRAWREP